eukprot:6030418-Pleurochrysis_carterae.AAC.1
MPPARMLARIKRLESEVISLDAESQGLMKGYVPSGVAPPSVAQLAPQAHAQETPNGRPASASSATTFSRVPASADQSVCSDDDDSSSRGALSCTAHEDHVPL